MNRNFEAIFSPQTPHKMCVNFEKKLTRIELSNYYYWRIETTCVTHKLNVKTPRVCHNQMELHIGSGDPCEQQPQNEPRREKTGYLHLQKQRRRSASR